MHSSDLRSFVLAPERRVPAFRPGQFLHLALDAWDPSAHWPESRVFSIASSPLERDRLRITVSRQGVFTGRMFEELAAGSLVWLKLPYGAFCMDTSAGGRAVLMAGGSGITPFVSFLQWASVRAPGAAIDLHYGARTPELLVYRDSVESCRARSLTNLRAYYYAETATDAEGLILGRLSVARAWQALEEPLGARYYLSGPKAMVDGFRRELLGLGARPEAVQSDDWG
ncbi:MAG: FAD-dependent oxidoreductase [Polyangiaceae bacterium]|nr:FAD-dependent oxidoreductase [Polyangiaceae bacterium]